ncbi:MAG TPA: iron ABC transporter permease [Candidatus Binatia bacterium]|jgi:iron(III) transport system permease protein
MLSQRSLVIGISLVPAAAIVGLLLIPLWVSVRVESEAGAFFGLRAYHNLLSDPFSYRTLFNTAIFSGVAVLTALFFGVPAAWIVERTNLPHKGLMFTLMTVGLLIPGFLSAMGWVFLLHPRIGLVNAALSSVLSADWARINIASPAGMGFVQGLGLAPLAFIMVAATFRSTNPELEEAAAVHGLGVARALIRVTLPLVFPGILAAAIYILTIGLAAFEVPAVIGLSNRVFTFSTYLYTQVHPQEGAPRYDLAAAFGVFTMIIAGLLSWGYFRVLRQGHRFAVVTGRSYRPRQVELQPRGVWLAWTFLGFYFVLGQLLPLLTLLWSSLLRYFQLPSAAALANLSLINYRGLPWPHLLDGLWNTALLMVSVSTFVLLVSFAISWIVVRSRARGRFLLDAVAFLPHAVPGIIFALSAAYVALFLLRDFVPIYGTVFLLMAVYILERTSFGTRMLNNALAQIHPELEEAGQVMGISLLRRMKTILFPLLLPALVNGWLWIALLTYRELTIASLLVTPANVTLPMVIWGLWQTGSFAKSAAAATMGLIFMLPFIFCYWFFGRRLAPGGAQT